MTDVMSTTTADPEKKQPEERRDGTENTTAVENKLQDPPRAMYGWRLHASVMGLMLSLLFSALETTIISTALTTIGTTYNKFTGVSWVVTAYLVTYSSFVLTYAKMTDIFGQRNCLLFALVLFALFSGLCGGAQDMSLTSLIVFRALQGIGGSGIYSVVFVTVIDICPARLVGPYSAVLSSIFAVANVLGPIIGGAISSTGDWEWIFLLNVPGAAVAMAVVLIALPGGDGRGLSWEAVRRFDFVGAFLSVACAVLLLYGLQMGGDQHPWNDAQIIGTITAGGVGILLFFAWEYILSRRERESVIEPLFPLRLLKKPKITLLLLSAFFQGCVFFTIVINTPQLHQIVHLSSATMAGVRTLPILLPMTFTTLVCGFILSKSLRFGYHMLAAGAIITVLGAGLLIEAPFTNHVLARTYGFQAILGVGLGFTMAMFILLARAEVQDRDNAVVTGSISMMRTMGGCIALGGAQAIMHSELPGRLGFLPANVVAQLLAAPTRGIKSLAGPQSLQARQDYNDVYRLITIMATGLAGVAMVVSILPLFLLKTKPAKGDSVMEKEASIAPKEDSIDQSEHSSLPKDDSPVHKDGAAVRQETNGVIGDSNVPNTVAGAGSH